MEPGHTLQNTLSRIFRNIVETEIFSPRVIFQFKKSIFKSANFFI